MKKVALLQKLQEEFPQLTKEKLYAYVMCGDVLVDGNRIRDPKSKILINAEISFYSKKYVSRGGYKLEWALKCFNFPVEGKVVIDAGSSTGGFTDCLLQSGAKLVHAIDVGRNQMAYKLRTDPRVVLKEQTGILDVIQCDPVADIAVADISFRSIIKPAVHLLSLSREKQIVVLIKPQFEWKNPDEDFSGVVDDPEQRRYILEDVVEELSQNEIFVYDMINSPITGRKGNREYLFLLGNKKQWTKEQSLEKIDQLLVLDSKSPGKEKIYG